MPSSRTVTEVAVVAAAKCTRPFMLVYAYSFSPQVVRWNASSVMFATNVFGCAQDADPVSFIIC